VKERRGTKIEGRETALFNGEFWTGTRAKELGLIDTIGDLRSVLRERYGEEVRTPLIADRGFFGRRSPGVGRGRFEALWQPPSLAEDVVATLEARTLWARYGL
jgi:serine protease SohB